LNPHVRSPSLFDQPSNVTGEQHNDPESGTRQLKPVPL
jgi:hypothetical protein